jgi:molybdate transport system ATP-binding protein
MAWRSHPEDEENVLDEVLELMRLATLADRGTEKLSGGERQRVSVARAVAAAATYDGVDKALLLLDEPFAGLDSVLRDELAIALRDWLARWEVPVLSVSHDVGECYLLGAEVVRMAEGQIMEQGPVEIVLAEERRRLMERLGVG